MNTISPAFFCWPVSHDARTTTRAAGSNTPRRRRACRPRCRGVCLTVDAVVDDDRVAARSLMRVSGLTGKGGWIDAGHSTRVAIRGADEWP